MLSPRAGSGSGSAVLNWKEKQMGDPVRAVLIGMGRGVTVMGGGGGGGVVSRMVPWSVVGVVTCGWLPMVPCVCVSSGRRFSTVTEA